MFSRKQSETEDRKMADPYGDPRLPMTPSRQAGTATTAPVRSPAMPPRTPEPARVAEPLRPADSPRHHPPELVDPSKPEGEMRRLSVGRGITLSGDINSCQKLYIEGIVEANLTSCRDLDIAESGLFKGSTSIEEAEVSGRFEGDLTVRKRLLIKATGRVSGTIRYGQLEIERGGQISGDIQAQPTGASAGVAADMAPARATV
jgi:cytoskeletal protein CcmA (bactofilin family)